VVIAHPEHEVRAGHADLRTVLQKSNVLGRGVFPAHLQAVADGFQANRVAGHAIADAVPHLLTHFLMWHYFPP
jgi:hypothetical protein